MIQPYGWTTFLFVTPSLSFPLFPFHHYLCSQCGLTFCDSYCTMMTHPRTPVLGPEGCMMTHGLTL